MTVVPGESAGTKEARLTAELLRQAGYQVLETAVVPDEQPEIEAALRRWCDERPVDLLVTTGGTGLFPPGRDPGSHAGSL